MQSMTDCGTCVPAAASRYTTGIPPMACLRAGKCGRTSSGSNTFMGQALRRQLAPVKPRVKIPDGGGSGQREGAGNWAQGGAAGYDDNGRTFLKENAMRETGWTEEDDARAEHFWAEYQKHHDVS